MITPEQRQLASERLNTAIEQYIVDMGGLDLRSDGTLGDWMLVASHVYVDFDQALNCEYFIAFRGGSMLQHVAYGLIAKGQELLQGGYCNEDENPDDLG